MRKVIGLTLVLSLACGRSALPVSSSKSDREPGPIASATTKAAADAGAHACCTVEDMRADLRALQELLESSHPDPYQHSGGAEAFRARFAEVERRLPASGLDVTAWHAWLRPLVAQIRDGHTLIRAPANATSPAVALDLEVVDERLVVSGVHDEGARSSLGAVVTSVEGVPVVTLAKRMAERRGYENVYTNLVHLAGALGSANAISELVERPVVDRVRFDLRLPDGALYTHEAPIVPSETPTRVVAPTRVDLPPTDASGIGAGFGADGRTAILRIDSSMRYREAFEVWRATGFTSNLGDHLDGVVRDVAGPSATTSSVDEKILLVPSFTDHLTKLFAEMKRKNTQVLIVDLRKNEGGNSAFAFILEYFLAPLDAILASDQGYQVPRYSSLYFANHTSDSLEKVRARTRPDFAVGDRDTSAEDSWRRTHQKPLSPEERTRRAKEFAQAVEMVPSFKAAFDERTWNASWKPRVVALTSATTYSAGFDAVLHLRAHGAKVVGVPSAQAANCFIDSLGFELPRSHLRGTISYKWSVRLPTDPKNGELLRPDTGLSYEAYAKLAFDPNAAYLLVDPKLARR